MKRIRRLLEPERPRSVAGPVLAAILLLAPIAVGLSAWQAKAPPATSVTARKAVAPILMAQAQPPQAPAPSAIPYRKWINEDVVYIIAKEEQAAFERLQTDDEREKFIEQFWLRRDPTPGTVVNEFKEEHYRRIAWANEHFAARIPGWKTDRGRIYITYGPPDEIFVGSLYAPPRDQGGDPTRTYPSQQWRYRFIEGIGTNVVIEFVDPTGSGEFHMTMDPSEKDRLLQAPDSGPGRAAAVQPQNALTYGQGSAPAFTQPQTAAERQDVADLARDQVEGQSVADLVRIAPASQNLADLDKQILDAEARLAALRRIYRDDFPSVKAAEAGLNNLKSRRSGAVNMSGAANSAVQAQNALASQNLADLDKRIIDAELALATARLQFSETHPAFRKADVVLARLKELRAEATKSLGAKNSSVATSKIYVMGSVKAPVAYTVDAGSHLTVLEGLALAGGLTQNAGQVAYIYRSDGAGQRTEIAVQLIEIVQRHAPDVPLVGNDILYVPDNKRQP